MNNRQQCDAYESETIPVPRFDRKPFKPSTKSRGVWIALGTIGGALVTLISLGLTLVAIFGGNPYGTRLKLKGGSELYYTSAVTKADAEKLADYLNNNFLKDTPSTFQLTKKDGTYQVRACVKDGKEHDEVLAVAWQSIAGIMSEQLFSGASVEVHLCNAKMETLRVIPFVARTGK